MPSKLKKVLQCVSLGQVQSGAFDALKNYSFYKTR